jgi:uncharacterized damage-inducible protein DinB
MIAAMNRTRVLLMLTAAGLLAWAQNDGPGAGQGWLPEFNHSARQILQLAEATPAEKFAWRPAPGVRSVSEVYMHIAVANWFLLGQAGVKAENAPKITMETEKQVKEKAEVVTWLKDSFEAVRKAYPPADPKKAVKFFGQDSNVENIYLRMLVHNHEHMGQSIAYARTNGVVPPWSK